MSMCSGRTWEGKFGENIEQEKEKRKERKMRGGREEKKMGKGRKEKRLAQFSLSCLDKGWEQERDLCANMEKTGGGTSPTHWMWVLPPAPSSHGSIYESGTPF